MNRDLWSQKEEPDRNVINIPKIEIGVSVCINNLMNFDTVILLMFSRLEHSLKERGKHEREHEWFTRELHSSIYHDQLHLLTCV